MSLVAVALGTVLGAAIPSGTASAGPFRGIGTRIEMGTPGTLFVRYTHKTDNSDWKILPYVNEGLTEGEHYSVVVDVGYLRLDLSCRSATTHRLQSIELAFYNPPLGTPTIRGLMPRNREVAPAEGASVSGGDNEVKVTVERKKDDTYTTKEAPATKSYLVRVTHCAA